MQISHLMAEMEFIGFHGTNRANVESILCRGFQTIGRDNRFGAGHYFFIDGCSLNPETDAKRWAFQAAYDRGTRKLKHPEFSVIRAKIRCRNAFDLRWNDHLKFFNEQRECLHDDLVSLGEKVAKESSKQALIDLAIINACREILNFDAVIMNYFSYRNYRKKFKDFQTQVPNASILCVYQESPDVTVDISEITEVSYGIIELPES